LAPQRRVCLIGPECTGKTTLAQRLAAHFAAPWVPEFAREYAERVARPLTFDDVAPIAAGQIALEDAAPPDAPLVILDTDLISTVVYARHHYGDCPASIEQAARTRRADLYLLLEIDTPWTADGVRDAGARLDQLRREFEETLAAYGAHVEIIAGNWNTRCAAAVAAIGRPYAASS
jgi:NadR type nicotinamide-nucleotide adenylyltransferase